METTINRIQSMFVLTMVAIAMVFMITTFTHAASSTSKEKAAAQKKAMQKAPVSKNSDAAGGQRLKLITPNGNESFIIGPDMTIRWQSLGLSGTVGLVLYNANKAVGLIEKNIPIQTGGHTWKAGILKNKPVHEGKYYRIFIYLEGSKEFSDFSDRAFALSHKKKPPQSKTPKIEVKWPTGSETIYVGRTTRIIWISPPGTGGPGNMVSIFLVSEPDADGRTHVTDIARFIQNNPGENNYTWQLFDARFGHTVGRRKVIITSQTGLRGESRFFTISPRSSGDSALPGDDAPDPVGRPREDDRPMRDLEIDNIYPADIVRFERISRSTVEGAAPYDDTYRLHINFRIRNNSWASGSPSGVPMPDLASWPCKWNYFFKTPDGNFTWGWATKSYDEPTTIQLGPFRSLFNTEWTVCPVEIDLVLKEAHLMEYDMDFYLTFELENPNNSPFRDPNLDNNKARTPIIERQARD